MMEDFYSEVLGNLYIYCGNRQAEKMTDTEIALLISVLCKVSKAYSYIPEEEQKRIIEKCLIEDKEYQNINARVISKWLELNGKKFFQEEAHKQVEPKHEPLTGEAREKAIANFLDAVSKVQTTFQTTDIKSAGERLKQSLYSPEEIEKRDKDFEVRRRQAEYRQANYAEDGNCLETWIPEDQWLKQNYPEI